MGMATLRYSVTDSTSSAEIFFGGAVINVIWVDQVPILDYLGLDVRPVSTSLILIWHYSPEKLVALVETWSKVGRELVDKRCRGPPCFLPVSK